MIAKRVSEPFHNVMSRLPSFQIWFGILARLFRLTDACGFPIGEFSIYFVDLLVLDSK